MLSRFLQHFGTFSPYFAGLFLAFALITAIVLAAQVYLFESREALTFLQTVKLGLALIGGSAFLALISTISAALRKPKLPLEVTCDVCEGTCSPEDTTTFPADRMSLLAQQDFVPSRLPKEMRDMASRTDIDEILSLHPLADSIDADTSDHDSALKSLWRLTVASNENDWVLCGACAREVSAAEQDLEPPGAQRPAGTPDASDDRPAAGNGGQTPPASAGFAAGSDAALYIFDYERMETSYGLQTFRSIRKAMAHSAGACTFSHGDLEVAAGGVSGVPALLSRLREQGWSVEAASPESDLKDLSGARNIPAYAVSMWTEDEINIALIHDHLKAHLAPAYLGCMVSGRSFGEVTEYLDYLRPYSLPTAIAFENGQILPDSNEIGI